MPRSSSRSSFWLFLLGLGSYTQVYLYGCIAISELAAFVIAPVLYIKNYSEMRCLGFNKFFNMIFLLMGALFCSSWYNHTPLPFAFKSFAVMYSIWAYFAIYFELLKKNLNGLKWLFIGAFFSSVISIFAFNPTAQVSESGFSYIGAIEVDDVLEGPLFWLKKFKDLVQIPICGYYLEVPLIVLIASPIIHLGIALATTVSGRASSVMFLISGAMIIIGRKNRTSMKSIGKHFFIYCVIGFIALIVIKQAYVYAAKKGYLSEDAQRKYEDQAKQGNSFLSLLMHGRTGFFAAIPAALNRPILGYGPYAIDEEGYAERFVLKYGDADDLGVFMRVRRDALLTGRRFMIPTHSYIMGAWVHYGVVGLIFYLWVLLLVYRHIKRYTAAIPQWYGYFAMMLPYYLWNIFFSPLTNRWHFALLISCLFFARAVGDGLMTLPQNMLKEIRKHEE